MSASLSSASAQRPDGAAELVPKRPVITPEDRFTLTLTLAVLMHALLILGVSFVKEDEQVPRFDTMEVTLVHERSEAPEQAELLAQANLVGGGESAEGPNPSTPLPTLFPDNQPRPVAQPAQGNAPPETVPPTAQQAPAAEPGLESAKPTSAHTAELGSAPPETQQELLTAQHNPEHTIAAVPSEQEPSKASPPPKARRPSPLSLLTNDRRIAALSAEIKRLEDSIANSPRQKFISANTREYKYAAYMEAWRAKVERVGNQHYPEQARRNNLSGTLILATALNPDGSLHEVTLRSSSGHRILDDAAVRIVKQAAPYPPLPADIRKETDILHIIRTWKFTNNRQQVR